MNDSELDALVAAAAPVGESEVHHWDLRGADADLCREIGEMDGAVETVLPAEARDGTDASVTGVTGVSATTSVATVTGGRRPHRRGRRRVRPVVAVAASVAAALAAVTAVTMAGSTEPPAVSTGDNWSSVATRSGRFEMHYRVDVDDNTIAQGVSRGAFSGTSTVFDLHPEGATYSTDGRIYPSLFAGADVHPEVIYGPEPVESYDAGSVEVGIDLRTLLEQFRGACTFQEVGTEQVGGVETRRFRATDPADAPVLQYAGGPVMGEVTSLDVWVDDEDRLRRADITTDRDRYVDSVSFRFADLGEPITIDVPTDPTTAPG